MKKPVLALFLLILSFAFMILPSISEAQGRPGGGGGYLGGVVGRGGSPGGPGGGGGYIGPHGGGGGYLGGVVGKGGYSGTHYERHYYGGPYRGYYGWGYRGYYRGYYPYWGYYPFFWGAAIVGWPYARWPYAYYSGWPYLGWPYYPPEVTEVPPAYSEPPQQQSYYWYYCQDPEGYYPYVKSCPGGWIEVEPKVAPPRQ